MLNIEFEVEYELGSSNSQDEMTDKYINVKPPSMSYRDEQMLCCGNFLRWLSPKGTISGIGWILTGRTPAGKVFLQERKS